MRITIRTLTVFFVFVIQYTLCDYIKILGVAPNLLLCIVVAIALSGSFTEAGVFALVAGILTDIFWGRVFGINAMLYFYIALSVRGFFEIVYKKTITTVAGITFVSSFVYGLVYFVLSFSIWGEGNFLYAFVAQIIPCAAYTALCNIVLYRPLDKLLSLFAERGSRT